MGAKRTKRSAQHGNYMRCQIIPRRGGSARQRQDLASALWAWHDEEQGKGRHLYLDKVALLDLLAGDSLVPFVLERLGTAPDASAPHKQAAALASSLPRLRVTRSLLPDTRRDRRDRGAAHGAVILCSLKASRSYGRRHLLKSLRRHVRAEWVEDVLVDGQSWDAADR